jgi:hypothetical protein
VWFNACRHHKFRHPPRFRLRLFQCLRKSRLSVPPMIGNRQVEMRALCDDAPSAATLVPLPKAAPPTGGMLAVRQHLQGEARNLGDDIINARPEARGRVVEWAGGRERRRRVWRRSAQCESRWLGREGGTAAVGWVHLDDDPAAIVRADILDSDTCSTCLMDGQPGVK